MDHGPYVIETLKFPKIEKTGVTNCVATNQKQCFRIERFCLDGLNDKLYNNLLTWEVILQNNFIQGRLTMSKFDSLTLQILDLL